MARTGHFAVSLQNDPIRGSCACRAIATVRRMTHTTLQPETPITTASPLAEALATRLEDGARALIAFALSLSDAEWRTPMPHDGRTLGVIVHHVASVYPIEMQLAQTIAADQPVTGVTVADIDAMNARHATEHAAVTKDVAVDLLRHNSAAAAAAIRALTDEQLARPRRCRSTLTRR